MFYKPEANTFIYLFYFIIFFYRSNLTKAMDGVNAPRSADHPVLQTADLIYSSLGLNDFSIVMLLVHIVIVMPFKILKITSGIKKT